MGRSSDLASCAAVAPARSSAAPGVSDPDAHERWRRSIPLSQEACRLRLLLHALPLVVALVALPARAHITFVGSGAAHATSPTVPAGYASKDILVAVCRGGSVAAGWTLKVSGPEIRVFWKRAASTESAPTFSGANRCRIAAFRGAEDYYDPFEPGGTVSSAYWNAEQAVTGGAPSITTHYNASWVLHAVAGMTDDWYSSGSVGTLSGAAPAATAAWSDSAAGGKVYAVGLYYGEKAVAGATGPAGDRLAHSCSTEGDMTGDGVLLALRAEVCTPGVACSDGNPLTYGDTCDATGHCAGTVPPASGVTLTPDKSSPNFAPVVFTAQGQGSSGYQYRFSLASGSTTAIVQDYGAGHTWTMPDTTAAGTYRVIVDVRTTPTSSSDSRAEVAYTLWAIAGPTNRVTAYDYDEVGNLRQVIDATADVNNCGGVSVACAGGETCCSGECAALESSPDHCGVCGLECPAPSGASAACCGGACADVSVDIANCGACGVVCPPAHSCCSGSCADMTSDPDNCGACGAQCSAPANAHPLCSSETCGFACNSGYVLSGGVCVCQPKTAGQACGTRQCGTVSNGCGGTISCGTCQGGTCNSGRCTCSYPRRYCDPGCYTICP